MKSIQVIYIELHKCKQHLDVLFDQMEALEKGMLAGVEALQPKKKGILAKFNPMADMPDLDGLMETFSVMPQYLELRAQERSFRKSFEQLHLELAQQLVNQHLHQGLEGGANG